MSQGVYTRNKRFQFVQGQETLTPSPDYVACGPGAPFCAEATLENIEEFFYRARDARFDPDGLITVNGTDSGGTTFTYFYCAGATPATLVVAEVYPSPTSSPADYWAFTARGYYTTYTPPATIPAGIDGRFSAAYEADAYLVDPDTVYHDALSFETTVWLPMFTNGAITATAFTITGNTGAFFGGDNMYIFPFGEGDLRSIYSLRALSGPINEGKTTMGSTSYYLQVYPYVAWVGGVSPTDPANRYFISLRFYAEIDGGDIYPSLAPSDIVDSLLNPYNNNYNPEPPAAPILSITLKLQSGDIVVPLMSTLETTPDARTRGNLNLKVVKWWSYAAGSPALPVWESETGVKIPADAVYTGAAEDSLAIYSFF